MLVGGFNGTVGSSVSLILCSLCFSLFYAVMAQSLAHSLFLGGPVDDSCFVDDFAGLSLSDLGRLPCPVMIFGPPASGKTTLGQALAVEYPDEFYHSSFGEEVRRLGCIPLTRAFLVSALTAGEGRRFVTIDGNFTPKCVLQLYEACPGVILLQIAAGPPESLASSMRKRGRVNDDFDRRIAAWRRRSGSAEMSHVIHVLGGRHIAPQPSVSQV